MEKYGVTCAKCDIDIEFKINDPLKVTMFGDPERLIQDTLPKTCPICGEETTWRGKR